MGAKGHCEMRCLANVRIADDQTGAVLDAHNGV
jgi:hypothetical protein